MIRIKLIGKAVRRNRVGRGDSLCLKCVLRRKQVKCFLTLQNNVQIVRRIEMKATRRVALTCAATAAAEPEIHIGNISPVIFQEGYVRREILSQFVKWRGIFALAKVPLLDVEIGGLACLGLFCKQE